MTPQQKLAEKIYEISQLRQGGYKLSPSWNVYY